MKLLMRFQASGAPGCTAASHDSSQHQGSVLTTTSWRTLQSVISTMNLAPRRRHPREKPDRRLSVTGIPDNLERRQEWQAAGSCGLCQYPDGIGYLESAGSS